MKLSGRKRVLESSASEVYIIRVFQTKREMWHTIEARQMGTLQIEGVGSDEYIGWRG